MSLFIKFFNTTAEYNAYTADTANFIKPNVSCAMADLTTVHYNPYVETRVVAKFNVTDTSNPTQIIGEYSTSPFSAIEIDGVAQPSVVSAYTFDTLGEHTVKYTLTDATSIGNTAFASCSGLTSIVIPSGVTSIGQGAFQNCSGLTSCTMGNSVTSIGNGAFVGCISLTSINIPSGATSIGLSAFRNCSSLTSIDIPNSVTSIGQSAFEYCSGLTSVTIPNSVTSIGVYAFNNTPWWNSYSADISHHYGNVIYINDVAYKATATTITSAELKDSTVGIGGGAFSGCSSLTSIDIPSGVTSIDYSAFYSCSSLTSIDIPSGVTSIDGYAFGNCTSLTSITSNATTAPTIQSSTFRNVGNNGTLTVPIGSSGYNVWMGTGNYYLGKYSWTKVEQ